jgi:hypothetical protein
MAKKTGLNGAIQNSAQIRGEVLNLLEKFKEPEGLTYVAKSMFKRGIQVPSDKWSYRNKLIMFCHRTDDARGFNAWSKAGRKVKAGGGFYILAPKIINVWEDVVQADGTNKKEKVQKCVGFRPLPVWAVEATDGKPVDYQFDKPMPKFLGQALAEKYGIKISQTTANLSYDGVYIQGKEIKMATDDQQTFFHELVHLVDDKLDKSKKFQDETKNEKELIAEFGSAVLMQIFGLQYSEKSVYDYIRHYTKTGDDIIESVFPLLERASKIINTIMGELEGETKK